MLEDNGNIKEQGERGCDGEVRQGLVFNEKKSSSSGPGHQAPWMPQQAPGALLGSVLRNNILEALGPLAFLWELPGPAAACTRVLIILGSRNSKFSTGT